MYSNLCNASFETEPFAPHVERLAVRTLAAARAGTADAPARARALADAVERRHAVAAQGLLE